MSFFKRYSGTTNTRLVRMERWIWTLIYGGLVCMVLGIFVDKAQADGAQALYTGGGVAVLAGVILIYVRSLVREDN
jgi:hypothetical protein